MNDKRNSDIDNLRLGLEELELERLIVTPYCPHPNKDVHLSLAEYNLGLSDVQKAQLFLQGMTVKTQKNPINDYTAFETPSNPYTALFYPGLKEPESETEAWERKVKEDISFQSYMNFHCGW
jgi:hypothetical protein